MIGSHSLKDRSIFNKPTSASFQFATTSECVANLVTPIARTTFGFNSQLHSYIQACNSEQEILLQRTNQYISRVSSNTSNPTATLLRDKNTWPLVKKLVVREELMKAQITGKVDFNIPGFEKQEILNLIQGKDISNLDDASINSLIDKITSTNDQQYLDALIQFKLTGQASNLIQQSKLSELSNELNNIDLKNITRDQYKHLLENYCERTEFHHRESISSNPNKQSLTDNVEPLKTSAHDTKHTDSETKKINYKKPLNEKSLDRTKEMAQENKRRVLQNELKGFGLAVAISFGVGFTMSFLAELAQQGIASDKMGDIVLNSIVVGAETSMVAGATYITGRMLSSTLEKAGVDLACKFGVAINTLAVGLLSTAIVCTYQYVKLRTSGSNIDESLLAIQKTAVTSLFLLTVSIIAQGVWGGSAGIIVSTSVGLLYFSTSICKSAHDRKIELRLREYYIEEYKKLIDGRKLIYIS